MRLGKLEALVSEMGAGSKATALPADLMQKQPADSHSKWSNDGATLTSISQIGEPLFSPMRINCKQRCQRISCRLLEFAHFFDCSPGLIHLAQGDMTGRKRLENRPPCRADLLRFHRPVQCPIGMS